MQEVKVIRASKYMSYHDERPAYAGRFLKPRYRTASPAPERSFYPSSSWLITAFWGWIENSASDGAICGRCSGEFRVPQKRLVSLQRSLRTSVRIAEDYAARARPQSSISLGESHDAQDRLRS